MDKERPKGKVSKESLFHFLCESCKQWWSVSDAPAEKTEWYCPWCGTLQRFESKH